MNVRLEVSHNKANVRRVVLRSDAVIGRAPDCNLRIASREVSRRHCKIILADDAVLVRDLGSSNGTFIDGVQIEPETDVAVAPGSQLSVGGVKFVVHFDAPVLAAADLEPDASGSTIDFDYSRPAPAPEHALTIDTAELGSDDETGDAWPTLPTVETPHSGCGTVPAEGPNPERRARGPASRVLTEHDTVFNNPEETVFEPSAGSPDVLAADASGPDLSEEERPGEEPSSDDLHGFLRQFDE